jgi:hypothetical protein
MNYDLSNIQVLFFSQILQYSNDYQKKINRSEYLGIINIIIITSVYY